MVRLLKYNTSAKLDHELSSGLYPANRGRFRPAGEHLVLKVPSATVPGDFNYLINPLHELSYQVKIAAPPVFFTFDKRLFKTGPGNQ